MALLSRFPGARVGYLHDVFRFDLSGGTVVNLQERNIAWLRALLGGPGYLERLGITACSVAPATDVKALELQFQNPSLWQRYLKEPQHAWASVFDADEPPALTGTLAPLLDCQLVIGFELPPVLRRWLNNQGVAYANFSIHPIRFLRDLCLSATTNDAVVSELLHMCRLDVAEIDAQANRFRARYCRHPEHSLDIDPKVPILVGQTERDASLIHEGRFVDWPEVSAAAALVGDDAVVFLQHPYRPDSTEVIEYLRCGLNKHVLSTASGGYPLLFSLPDRRRFVTLSSSLGVEASVLGHDVRFLLGDPRERAVVAGVDRAEQFMLNHLVFSQQDDFKSEFFLGEGYLRNSLEGWSYEKLVRSADAASVHWTFLPATAEAHPSCVLRSLASEVEDTATFGLPIVRDGPPVGPGTPRSWDASDPTFVRILRHGFHAPEAWGTWSSEIRAGLHLPVRPSTVEITLNVQIFEQLACRAPVLAIYAEGELCALAFFRKNTPLKQSVSFRTVALNKGLRIELEMPEQASPLECGVSSDVRRIGFALLSVSASEVMPDPANSVLQRPKLVGIEPEMRS